MLKKEFKESTTTGAKRTTTTTTISSKIISTTRPQTTTTMLKTRALKTSTVGTTTTRITVDKLPPAVLILPSSFDVTEVNLAVDQFPTGITNDLSVIVGAEPVVQSKIPEEVDVTEDDLFPVKPVEPVLVAAAIESLG